MQQAFVADPFDPPELVAAFRYNPGHGTLGLGQSSGPKVASALKTDLSPMDNLLVTNFPLPYSTALFAGAESDAPNPTAPIQFSGFLFIVVDGSSLSLSNAVQGTPVGSAWGHLTTRHKYTVVSHDVASAIYVHIGGVDILFDPGTAVVRFQVDVHRSTPPAYDIAFGMYFLINAYVLLVYQTVVGRSLCGPYMRLLPLAHIAANAYANNVSGQQGAPGSRVHTHFHDGYGHTYAYDHRIGRKPHQECLRRRLYSGVKESAYRDFYRAETADRSRSLYGHDEDAMKYCDLTLTGFQGTAVYIVSVSGDIRNLSLHLCVQHAIYRVRFQSTWGATQMSVQQPAWHLPKRKVEEPVLKVYNSLTRTKTEFVPSTGRHIKWYNCGPTVYDASHMGHARNYVTQDVLRRIMTDYFGYDVHFVMNITDIDDKIIIRARQNYLVDKFREKQTALTPELVEIITRSWDNYVQSKVAKGLPDEVKPIKGQEAAAWPELANSFQNREWKQECLRRDEKFEMHFTAANRTFAALQDARTNLARDQNSQDAAHALIDASKDILALTLDKEVFSQEGSTVTDPSIFRALSAYWEAQFFDDMHRLRVRDPDTLTRVTEYVPEIVAFVEGIIKNGL
ncbi:hypothetical protein NM688_g7456 [Phlebia brevispora]|uniref:Uncharacterized protein n=1 Tax=Phlebia brevispora TaxID=194682 RepID=A0ACC1S540_9APHY|nr:hypothetical protein NM688_g7456 [Phlebia brevispora]